MELRHLRYFVAVAEELHFGRAAVRLRIAQPPLSHQIRQLEQQLGVALFNRTKRRVELTAAGEAFLAEAYGVIAQAERAVRSAQRAGRGEIGELAIGFVPSADLDILPRVLSAWAPRFPGVEVTLHALLPDQQLDALREGRIQVGFVRLPVRDESLVVEPISREPLVAVLPEHHRLAQRPSLRVADLQEDPMVLFPRRIAAAYHDQFVRLCRRSGFTPRVAHETTSLQTNLGLVAAGLGISVMPASIQNLRRTGVVYRPLDPPVPYVEMALAYPREHRSATLPAFLDVVREVIGTAAPRRADRKR
jgi:DNA-binding transcriptional LysR family regulator